MEHDIDLLIMPPLYSHLLQPLDVEVFAAFKRAHSGETNAVFRLNTQRIFRFKWLQMFQRAKAKAVTPTNIRAGFKNAGLMPNNPSEVFKCIPTNTSFSGRPIHTPPEQIVMEVTLLKNSPPEGAEFHQSNITFTSAICYINDVITPIKRYAKRITYICKTLLIINAL